MLPPIRREDEVRNIVQEAVSMAQHACIENLSVLLERQADKIAESVESTINTQTATPRPSVTSRVVNMGGLG